MNQMALMFRLMAWFQRVRATVGPERFDRIVGFLLRQRRRIRWLVTMLLVAGPPALAIHVRVFGLLPRGPYPVAPIEQEFFVGTVVPVLLLWIGLLWVGRVVGGVIVSWALDRLGLGMLRGMLP